ncbi:hypothetical protein N825_14945 [Skermanella stibiiresistens SB22]|uniref:Uncharacterized protein n=1 Tax=Skermanella stibiiresistens SB22 TaxID=1385369 RepID=W9GWF0_9PROT|nr:hypothetical protein N825_14945 [Skermanella stibiiresistens SB22]
MDATSLDMNVPPDFLIWITGLPWTGAYLWGKL